MPVKELVALFRRSTPDQAADWLKAHPSLPNFLDTVTGGGTKLIVSDHQDELRRVERGYGA